MDPMRAACRARRRRRAPWRLATIALCLPLGACASSTGGGSGSTVTASAVQHPMLENFPIPNGFRMISERSYAMKTGELRQVTCEFEGNMDPVAVNRFYREYMPSAGFTLRAESMIRGEWLMEFDSPGERSTVRFRRDKFKTVIVIDVSPTPRGSAERDAKPPLRRTQP